MVHMRCALMYVCVYVCMYVYTHKYYIYIYIYIYVYILFNTDTAGLWFVWFFLTGQTNVIHIVFLT